MRSCRFGSAGCEITKNRRNLHASLVFHFAADRNRPLAGIPPPKARARGMSVPDSSIHQTFNSPPTMKTLFSLIAVLALVAAPVFAEDKAEAKPEAKPAAEPAKPADPAKPEEPAKKPQVSPEERFKKLDKDSNGSLSLDEFRGKKSAEEAGEAFKKLDADGNGSVSLEEFTAANKKKGKKEKN